jgi:hypothetical protein
VTKSRRRLIEDFNAIPEVIEINALSEDLAEIQRQLPSFANPHELSGQEKELWDRYIAISERLHVLYPIMQRKKLELLKKSGDEDSLKNRKHT